MAAAFGNAFIGFATSTGALTALMVLLASG
jgi:hypothetical protein